MKLVNFKTNSNWKPLCKRYFHQNVGAWPVCTVKIYQNNGCWNGLGCKNHNINLFGYSRSSPVPQLYSRSVPNDHSWNTYYLKNINKFQTGCTDVWRNKQSCSGIWITAVWARHLFATWTHFGVRDHRVSPPSLSLARCVWTAFALLWLVLSVCLFSGLSDLRSTLQGGVTSVESRIFSCRRSPPGWLLDEYLSACRHKSNTSLQSSVQGFHHHQKVRQYRDTFLVTHHVGFLNVRKTHGKSCIMFGVHLNSSLWFKSSRFIPD